VLNEFDETYKDAVEQDYYRWNAKTTQTEVQGRYKSFFQKLKTFCENRNDYITTQMKEALSLDGDMVNVNVNYTSDGGTVKLNTIDVDDGFTGKYYTDYPVTLTAQAKDGYTFIGWNVEGATVVNAKSKTITLSLSEDTTVTAKYVEADSVGILGDVNGDNKVDIRDVTSIQIFLVDKVTFTDKQKILADVNSDGVVNVKDATYIQQYCCRYGFNSTKIGEYVEISKAENPTTATESTTNNGEWLPGYFD
jgi:uncharacterized repeat protein (TIGR02543 family)